MGQQNIQQSGTDLSPVGLLQLRHQSSHLLPHVCSVQGKLSTTPFPPDSLLTLSLNSTGPISTDYVVLPLARQVLSSTTQPNFAVLTQADSTLA